MSASLYKTRHQIKTNKVVFLALPLHCFHLCRKTTPYPYNGVKIIFDPTVEITESVKVYTGLSVLSNIGGFLGLFLGYSLLDGYRVVYTVLMFIKKFTTGKEN